MTCKVWESLSECERAKLILAPECAHCDKLGCATETENTEPEQTGIS